MATQDSTTKPSTWEKTKGFLAKASSGEPFSKVRSKAAAETFWPATLDKESDKATAILRSYFIDGFVVPYRTLNRIPNEVLRHAKGVVVFAVLRDDLQATEAAGSGIIVARGSNGQWSAPAAILIHTTAGHFKDGGDAYDCVCVINDEHAMQAFTKPRCTFDDDFSSGPGPLGGSMNDAEIKRPDAPVWLYVKSKGHSIEVQAKGASIVERQSENERFYDVKGITNAQILAGKVQTPSGPASQLLEALKAIESLNHDSGKLPSFGKSPGDYELELPKRAG